MRTTPYTKRRSDRDSAKSMQYNSGSAMHVKDRLGDVLEAVKPEAVPKQRLRGLAGHMAESEKPIGPHSGESGSFPELPRGHAACRRVSAPAVKLSAGSHADDMTASIRGRMKRVCWFALKWQAHSPGTFRASQ